MLLTRSRLCPRPKPGSSLHLHVLGTPPAFVLSQDQTLREELHKESSRNRSRRTEISGLSLEGSGPCATRGEPGTQWAPGRKTGSILAPPSVGQRPSSDGVEPGHTPRPRIGREVRMLLSFQRPSHLLGRVVLPDGTLRLRTGTRGGQMMIALRCVLRQPPEHAGLSSGCNRALSPICPAQREQ